MASNKISNAGRVMVFLGSLALLTILFVPMWQIQLSAPQYPEGLVLRIYPNKLGGNLEIINGLNHYIGMKPIHADDFIELKILPYIVALFAVALFVIAIDGKRKPLHIFFFIFLLFGILAMYDFWKWEYDYGHNLNPDAAIVVPGMAYQPPLIGFKQLLNFGAYSIPDIGGWLFVAAGVLVLIVIIKEYLLHRKKIIVPKQAMAGMIIILLALSSCNSKPDPINVGVDQCSYCTMTVSDNHFGAEILTKKGKTYKFDDTYCLLEYLNNKSIQPKEISSIYITDFSGEHRLLNSSDVILLKSDQLKGPMGGNFAAFNSEDSAQKLKEKFPGTLVRWSNIYKQ
jgi:copper chaperone NosL